MARYRRRDAIELRVASGLEIDGTTYTVDVIAKRATGVPGYRMTAAFVAEDGSRTAFVDLGPAPGRDEAKAKAEQLSRDPASVRELLRAGSAEAP